MKPVRLISFLGALLLPFVVPAQQRNGIASRLMHGDANLVLSKRAEAGKYIVAATLDKRSDQLYFVNRYSEVWDSLRIQQKEADSLIKNQLDPFLLYHRKTRLAIACQDELIRQFRTYGRLDSLSPLYRSALLNFPGFKQIDSLSAVRHIITLEKQNRRDSIYAWGINADDPKLFLSDQVYDAGPAAGKYTRGDTLVFINADKLSPICRARLISSEGHISYFDRRGKVITAFTLDRGEIKAGFERVDVFDNYLSLLERGKIILANQVATVRQGSVNRYAVLDQRDRALTELQSRQRLIDEKLAYAVAPDLEALKERLHEDYKNRPPDHEWLSYLGITDLSTPPSWDSVGNKRYELTNHLGNVMATISDAGTSVSGYYKPMIQTAQDYYGFGALMPGRNINTQNTRYGFNGKENDNEVKGLGNQQDYGMRIYDPRLGRFLSVDPLTKQYPHYTPYSFAGNSPIANTDKDGEEELHYLISFNKQGKSQIRPTYKGDGVLCNCFGAHLYVEYKGQLYYQSSFSTSKVGTWFLYDVLKAPNLQQTLKTFEGKTSAELDAKFGAQQNVQEMRTAARAKSEKDMQELFTDAFVTAWAVNRIGQPIEENSPLVKSEEEPMPSIQEQAQTKVGVDPSVKIPDEAISVAEYATSKNGAAQPGFKGGRVFENDGRDGGEVLPLSDENGNLITYREYDVHPYVKGQNRGQERVVIGSNKKVYYTNEHYRKFTEIKPHEQKTN
jgi:RHS repeat-associated protein